MAWSSPEDDRVMASRAGAGATLPASDRTIIITMSAIKINVNPLLFSE
jgi:hypothetical protein